MSILILVQAVSHKLYLFKISDPYLGIGLFGCFSDFDWYITVDVSSKDRLTCFQSVLRVYRKSILLDDQFLDSNWMIFEDKLIFHSCNSLAPPSPPDSSFWTVWEKGWGGAYPPIWIRRWAKTDGSEDRSKDALRRKIGTTERP